MLIRTAEQQEIVRNLAKVRRRAGATASDYRLFVEELVRQRWGGQLIDWDHAVGSIFAEIIRSNWIVQCIFCRNGIIAQPGEHFYCPDCMMQGNGFKPMEIVWPESSERREIERLLLKRIDPNTRNWFRHETTADLLVENLEHGDS